MSITCLSRRFRPPSPRWALDAARFFPTFLTQNGPLRIQKDGGRVDRRTNDANDGPEGSLDGGPLVLHGSGRIKLSVRNHSVAGFRPSSHGVQHDYRRIGASVLTAGGNDGGTGPWEWGPPRPSHVGCRLRRHLGRSRGTQPFSRANKGRWAVAKRPNTRPEFAKAARSAARIPVVILILLLISILFPPFASPDKQPDFLYANGAMWI